MQLTRGRGTGKAVPAILQESNALASCIQSLAVGFLNSLGDFLLNTNNGIFDLALAYKAIMHARSLLGMEGGVVLFMC